MPLNPAGNWYQQFITNIGGRQINDITFTDSLHGFAITNEVSDTSFVLRTTNGGDNWTINHFDSGICSYYSVQFLNTNTGFVSGYIYNGSNYRLLKTTNGGNTWVYVDHSSDIVAIDMHVLSIDTIWLVDSGSLTGGVYRTTNGGASWDHQINLGSSNPDHLFMYSSTFGFIGKYGGSYLRRTTNGGLNWDVVESGGFNGFSDMCFVNTLTGYRAISTIKKTTDGGISWVSQVLPQGGQIITSAITKISVLNKDTLWGIGGEILVNSQSRGIIYRTINGGQNWTFQTPDTGIFVPGPYNYIQFVNSKCGWAYTLGLYGGIHTTTGGDPVWLTGIEQISSEVPKEYKLFQNFPNPFNPSTNIKYQITNNRSYIKLIVYDIAGREIIKLVDREQNAGTYKVDWNASGYSSGVYFYTLTVNGNKTDTRKMILIK